MQNRKKAPSGLYTAKEAIAKIGIPQSSFYNLVRAGTIKVLMLPGRKEGFYSKRDIDRYARAMRSYIEQFNNQQVYFGLALIEDLPDIYSMVARVCGGPAHAVPIEVMQAWLRRNNQSIHTLRQGSEIVGYVSMFPLPLDTIIKRMSAEYLNRTLPIDDIAPFIPGEPIRLYIAEAVVDQERPNHIQLGVRLMQEIARFLVGLAEQGIVVSELYAVGTSKYGIRTCRSLGMSAMDIPEGTRAERIPFKLAIASATDPLISSYRKKTQAIQQIGIERA